MLLGTQPLEALPMQVVLAQALLKCLEERLRGCPLGPALAREQALWLML